VRRWSAAAALTAAGALAVGALATGSSGESSTRAAEGAPNIVVIVTDDQRAETLRAMPAVGRLLEKRGTTFANAYSSFSLCCPSRATLLTGQYAHNHGVMGNAPPEGGFEVFQAAHGDDNLATWLQDGGYRTALVGKYFNDYGSGDPRLVPAGWDQWFAAAPPGQRLYDYAINDGGRLRDFGTAEADFKTDVLTDAAVRVIGDRSPEEQPFLLYLAYTAPHVGGPKSSPRPPRDCAGAALPAPRHAGAFDSAALPMPPSFDERSVGDKPRGVGDLPPISASEERTLRRTYRCYLESLLAVDEGVAEIARELRERGELDETLMIFTSDNGLFFGEHRIRGGKIRPYEPAGRVPLLISGPGVKRGAEISAPVSNVDLAPTIMDAAGLDATTPLDGQSLLPLAGGSEPAHPDVLLESRTFAAVRTGRYLYTRHTAGAPRGEAELYDLRRDPDQLRNLAGAGRRAGLEARLGERLDRLQDCAGPACRIAGGP